MIALISLFIAVLGLTIAVFGLVLRLVTSGVSFAVQFFSATALFWLMVKVRWIAFYLFDGSPNVALYATFSPILLLLIAWGAEKIPDFIPKNYLSRIVCLMFVMSGLLSLFQEGRLLFAHAQLWGNASLAPVAIPPMLVRLFPPDVIALIETAIRFLSFGDFLDAYRQGISSSWGVADWKLIFMSAFTICFGIGWFFVMGGSFATDPIKEATDNIHGKSKWADLAELKKLFGKGDLIFGTHNVGQADEHVLKANLSKHALTIAGTGGGKSRSIIIPNVLSYPRQLILFDPKGEISDICAEERKAITGRDYRIIDTREGIVSDSVNILEWIDSTSRYAQKHCSVLSEAFTDGDTKQQNRDPFFEKRGQGLLAVAMYDTVVNPSLDDSERTLTRVVDFLSSPRLQNDLERIKENIHNYPNPKIYGQKIDQLLRGASAENQVTFSGIQESTTGLIDWLSDPALSPLINGGSGRVFSIKDILEDDLDLYITVDSGTLQANPSLARLLITTVFYQFKRGLKTTKGKSLFIIDEMPRLGKLGRLAEYRDEIRGYGVTMWSFVQSLSQLKEIWGLEGANIWLSSAEITQYTAIEENNLAEYIEKNFGTYTEYTVNETENKSLGSPMKFQLMPNLSRTKGRNVRAEKRSLIKAQEVLMLAEDGKRQQLIRKGGDYPANPVKTGLKVYWDYPKFKHLTARDSNYGA